MQNVQTDIQENTLVIVVDLTQSLGLSQSGKSELVASTGGGIALPGLPDVTLNLTVYRPLRKRDRF